MSVWWKNDPTEFALFKKELESFKRLNYKIENDQVIIKGGWPVYADKKFIRSYKILMRIPDDYPNSHPIVFETGGAIHRDPDFHINEDGSACLFARPERFEKCPPGTRIKAFLNGPVKSFFFSQAFKEKIGEWPFGEWSHGPIGTIEYYGRLFKTPRISVIKSCLELALLRKLYRQWKCPCGSGNRLIKCHGEEVKFIHSTVPQSEIKDSLSEIEIATKHGFHFVEVKS